MAASKKKTKRRAAPAKKAASRRKASASKRVKQRPIELYFWPTSNGLKISIMLEECRLPYEMKPININRGEQFAPDFLRISPNNRIPAIVDPDGPGGKSIAIFESGAILQYLGRKTGKLYPKDERSRVEVDQWLFWQIGGLGPMAGQAHHFRGDASEQIPYAIARYTDEVNRLYGVMNERLADLDYLAGRYSIADIASWTWSRNWKRQGQNLDDFPHVKAWHERIAARPAVQRGRVVGEYLRDPNYQIGQDPIASKILFGQRARPTP
jgi:glutathione S-transferase